MLAAYSVSLCLTIIANQVSATLIHATLQHQKVDSVLALLNGVASKIILEAELISALTVYTRLQPMFLRMCTLKS